LNNYQKIKLRKTGFVKNDFNRPILEKHIKFVFSYMKSLTSWPILNADKWLYISLLSFPLLEISLAAEISSYKSWDQRRLIIIIKIQSQTLHFKYAKKIPIL
jgi:hypothetical protein